MVSERDVWAALGDVEDPELPLSIVDMGLVYEVDVRDTEDGTTVAVDMTFTAMGCPAMGLLKGDVQAALQALDGVDAVEIHTVWDPPWTKDCLSDEAKAVLQTAGVGV